MTEHKPDREGELQTTPPPPDTRTVYAQGERLTRVEVKQEQAADDLKIIRSSLHAINNELQKSVNAEMRCAESLTQIHTMLKDLPTISQMVVAFSDMRPTLQEVLEERQQRRGMVEFWDRFRMIVVAGAGLVAMIGGVAAAIIWMFRNINPPGY